MRAWQDPKKTNLEFVKMAQEAVKRGKRMEELREAHAILLPSIAGATLAQTALLLGVSLASVHRLQVGFRKRHTSAEVLRAGKKWGGRHRSLLTEQEEKEFPGLMFSDMATVERQLQSGLHSLRMGSARIRSITAWPWVVSFIL